MSTAQKTALITGAARGIGAAIALRLARDGFNVVVNYAGSEAAANEVAAQIKASGGRALPVQANVADAAATKALFERAIAEFGGVDVVVSNAGIMKLAPIAQSDDALFDSQVATNLKGTFNLLREAANRMNTGGAIVTLSTSVVGLKLESYGVYAATKAAVETMTAILSKELRGRAITVNAIAPGPTATQLFMEGKPDHVVEHLAKMSPLERLGTPEDIANAVGFLAGEDGRWINGQTLRANGGIV
ncbi:SDR family oxidoreductase [Alphaproteobacteria bacterium KMM 3653]|uniref:SDR family oxidoreductase n=2 Tax=Harenicola maris TaxID=2841044 RepID=A0AAP2CQG3_9RHOB|nr:SDR family oxidoreductase [Harenicola maris]